MAANSRISVESVSKRTRSALSVSDRLEILEQAARDLAAAGIDVKVSRLFNAHPETAIIVLPGVQVDDGHLVLVQAERAVDLSVPLAINGNTSPGAE